MTPAQRQRLDAVADRVGLDAGKEMIRTMRRIDRRKPLARSFTAAKRARACELAGAFLLIAACIAATLFL